MFLRSERGEMWVRDRNGAEYGAVPLYRGGECLEGDPRSAIGEREQWDARRGVEQLVQGRGWPAEVGVSKQGVERRVALRVVGGAGVRRIEVDDVGVRRSDRVSSVTS